MERRLTQNSKAAIEAKKQLMEEKLAMSKATREWQEDWTQRLKQHHFEAVAHSEDLERQRTQNQESSAELSTLRERVAALEGELEKERADYKELKKEAGTTLRFLQKERNVTRKLKDEKAAVEAEGKEAAAKLSEAQSAAMEMQQSGREQLLEAKIEDLEGQLKSEAQMSELWRDKHDKAVQERAYAVDLLNAGGEGAAGSGTLQQLLSAQRQVEELKLQVEQLQSAASANVVRPREPEPETPPAADDDPAALARAAQQARRTRLEPQGGGATASGHDGQEPATPGSGGSVEDALLSAQELRLRLSETDPRKLRQKLPADVQRSVEDEEIVLLSQRRVDAVIQQIIRVQMGEAGADGNDTGGQGSTIRTEDMSLPGVESYVQGLWVELLQVLQDNADLRKNNLILHHERQQQVSQRENDLRDSLEPQRHREGSSLPAMGAAGLSRHDADAAAPSGGNAAHLDRVQSAPLARTRTTPSQYGSGMRGYVRRCYAECQDQSAYVLPLLLCCSLLRTALPLPGFLRGQSSASPCPEIDSS